jgi:FkbM family methyltransferase
LLKSNFKGFTVYHRSQKEFFDLIEHIKTSGLQLKPDKKEVFIVDAGAHIGIMTLCFKSFFPNSYILCFEPSPESYRILVKNIEANKIKNVTTINAALSDTEGTATLYGRMGWKEIDTRGNSIIPSWGLWQGQQSCKVKTVKLSSYINCPVDLLKLDVEGAELSVILELEKEKKLEKIKAMIGEIHATKDSKSHRNKIHSILEKRFKFISNNDKPLSDFVPNEIKQASQKNDAVLTEFIAENKLFEDPVLIVNSDDSNKVHESSYKLTESQILEHN